MRETLPFQALLVMPLCRLISLPLFPGLPISLRLMLRILISVRLMPGVLVSLPLFPGLPISLRLMLRILISLRLMPGVLVSLPLFLRLVISLRLMLPARRFGAALCSIPLLLLLFVFALLLMLALLVVLILALTIVLCESSGRAAEHQKRYGCADQSKSLHSLSPLGPSVGRGMYVDSFPQDADPIVITHHRHVCRDSPVRSRRPDGG